MLLFVTILHFIVAIMLIVMVLIQDSKGGGVFGMGSSGSNQVFSATGAANFLVKATRFLAVMFAITCLALTYITSNKHGTSVVDDYTPAAATAPAPTAPSGAAAPSGATPSAATPADSAPQKPEAPK